MRLYTFIIRGEAIVNKIEAVPFSPPYICRAAFSDDVLDEMRCKYGCLELSEGVFLALQVICLCMGIYVGICVYI